ncbi:MAG: glycoside hydrolase family 2, partial [Kiritimatiellae bacterium]|nr:glycoside hydrolase family 2 [Kiritimatiellia bacterium]
MVLKKTLSAGVLMLALVGAAGAADPSPCVAVGTDIPKASSVSLNGAWQLKGWPTPDRGSVRTLEEVPAETISIPATVPGCYELDLCAAGLLPNLFYSNNQYAARKYEGHQWLYSRTFTLGAVASDEKAVLEFDGLDTLCDVFVNGRKVGEAADMFIPHAFDVTKFVRAGENELAVLFRSPVVESQFSEIAPIGNAGSTSELEAFRKPSHMIGWDILPRFISAGIFRDARVVVRKPERIREHFCALLSLDPEKRSAQYLLDLRLEGPFRRLDTSEIEVTVARKGKVVRRLNGKVMHWTPRFRFGIDNADLWWPLGFGEPALYDVKVAWRDCATKAILAEKSFKLGVKKVEFELADYDIATKKPGEMKFIVNGKPCFIRGTSWTPADALHCR